MIFLMFLMQLIDMKLNSIKKLIYVVYPSGLGGEFLSYIISHSVIDCNKNSIFLIPDLNGAWHSPCIFRFFAEIQENETPILQNYIDDHNVDFSKWLVCRDHHRDNLYNFLINNFPDVKIIVLMPELNDEYFAKLCTYKTSKLLDATEENLKDFISHNYNEFFSNVPITRNWNHETSETLIDYRPYMKRFREKFFHSKEWFFSELWLLASSILNNGSYLEHNPNIEELIRGRRKAYENDIKHLNLYINNFDTLVIPGNIYKKSYKQFFKILSSKFDILPSEKIKKEFKLWIDTNNKIING